MNTSPHMATPQNLGLGDVFRRSARGNSASVGPGRRGKPIAKLWRIWAQGDEFYLSQRDAIKLTKMSFHSGGNWHYDLGELRQKLGPATPLSLPEWALALQMKFLIHQDPPPPSPVLTKLKKSSSVMVVETAPGRKLVLNILTAPAGAQLNGAVPREIDGVRCLVLPLRSEGTVIVTAGLHPLEAEDFEFLERMRGTKMTVTGQKRAAPRPTAELMQFTAGPPANLLSIAPMLDENIDISYEGD